MLLPGRLPGEALSDGSPSIDGPDREPAYGFLQDGYVIGDQEKAQRQHPYAQERQDREDPAEDQQDAHRDPDPSGIGMADTAQDLGDLAGNLVLQALERLPQDGSAALVCHALRSIHR